MTSPVKHIRLHATTTADGRGLLELRDDLRQAAAGADGLDDSMARSEKTAAALEAQIGKTKLRIRELGEEFAATGDRTLFGELRQERSFQLQLERMKKEAESEGDSIGVTLGSAIGTRAGKGVLSGVGDAFGGMPSKLRGIAIAGIVGLVAAAAVPLGAMIAGAVTGTIGLGGIAGGIAAAARDPGVRAEAKQFGSAISSSFFQSANDFAEPVVDALGILRQGFYDLDLKGLFREVAPYVNDIAHGLAGFGRNFMAGFTRALDKAGPLLEMFGRELPRVGTSLGYMFDRMAEGEGTLQGFYFLLGVIEATFHGIGNTLGWLSDRFYEFNNLVADISGFMEDLPGADALGGGAWRELNDNVETFIAKSKIAEQEQVGMSRGFRDVTMSAEETVRAISKVNDSLRETQSLQLALSDATLAYQRDLLDLNEQVKENGTSLDANTEKGNANRQMINRLIGDLQRERDAAIDAAEGNQEKVDKANAAYADQVKKLQILLGRLGFEKSVIAEIIGLYKRIPPRITTEIIQIYKQQGKPAGEHSGVRSGERGPGFAGGGVTPAFQPFRVHDGETLWSSREHFVATKSQSQASGGGTSGPVTVQLVIDGRVIRQVNIDEALRRGVPEATVRAAFP